MFETAQIAKKEAYEAYDASRFGSVTTDEKSMKEFETGGGQSMYMLPFYLVCALPFSVFLLPFGPFTIGLTWLVFWVLFVAAFLSEIWIIVGLLTSNAPIAMLAWMPNEAAASGGEI